MIRINLHDYRDELRKIEIQKKVVKCSAIVIGTVLLIIVNWFMKQARLDLVKRETQKLESKVAGLKRQVDRVKKMETSKKRLEFIIAGIEGLRAKQLPASLIVSDLNLIIPDDLWLSGIVQKNLDELKRRDVPVIMFEDPNQRKKKKKRRKKKSKFVNEFLEVTGYALSENGVVEYLKRLQNLPYFKAVFLYKSYQTFIGEQSIFQFVVYCYMPAKPEKKV
jgi:Tfp pilus assembly protein PilN